MMQLLPSVLEKDGSVHVAVLWLLVSMTTSGVVPGIIPVEGTSGVSTT